MKTITIIELKNHLDEYIKLGTEETIQVTQDGKSIFVIASEKERLLDEWDKMFGTLPKEALNDTEIERE